MPKKLLDEIEEFLTNTGMGSTYIGKISSGNSELVRRLRSGGRVWPETAERVRQFMRDEYDKRAESPEKYQIKRGRLLR